MIELIVTTQRDALILKQHLITVQLAVNSLRLLLNYDETCFFKTPFSNSNIHS